MKRRSAVPTRERILNEAERLIALKGVHGFRLRDVAEPLQVRVPAIYKHFRSRDDVLVEVSRRLIAQLAGQFTVAPTEHPAAALQAGLYRFVEFKLLHPAYVRLALVDFATPAGGMEYLKQAAGGSFEENFPKGPLVDMHDRLSALLRSGARARCFRRVNALDFYRVVKSALLVRLVFPNDQLLLKRPSPAQIRDIQRWLWDLAMRFLAPRGASSGRLR